MIIAGGSYYEECQFPYESDFFGSGVRAAAATGAMLPSRNQLHTCIGCADQERLKTYADTFDFDIHTTEIPETISFDYLHNHSNPKISPRGASDNGITLSGIDGEAVLRFGLVEGTAVVSGKRVVYDPQSSDPDPFHRNGSTADELALVLNHKEAVRLSDQDNLESIFRELMAGTAGADVVVIKLGARGAVVKTAGEISQIPVFQTTSVWGVGSGDVFSAVFAGEWAERSRPALDAALTASKATAYYCQSRVLPITMEATETLTNNASASFRSPNKTHSTIYLAGPFFDVGERFVVEEVKHILESEGANVISPIHDFGRAADYESADEVAKKDLEAIDEADLVFALLDHLDSGTHFELGYARKAEIPVIGYASDADTRDNTMINGSGCMVYGDLASAIYNAIWRSDA